MSGILKIITGNNGTTIQQKLELVHHTNPILKTKTLEWDFKKPPTDPVKLCNEMIDVLKDTKGLAIACPQVGLSYRMFVIDFAEHIVAMFNPSFSIINSEKEFLEEGCLSFPGLRIKISRYKNLMVTYYDYLGKEHITQYNGLTARIIQHELDHLNGITFTMGCTRLKLEPIIKKASILGFNYKIKDLL